MDGATGALAAEASAASAAIIGVAHQLVNDLIVYGRSRGPLNARFVCLLTELRGLANYIDSDAYNNMRFVVDKKLPRKDRENLMHQALLVRHRVAGIRAYLAFFTAKQKIKCTWNETLVTEDLSNMLDSLRSLANAYTQAKLDLLEAYGTAEVDIPPLRFAGAVSTSGTALDEQVDKFEEKEDELLENARLWDASRNEFDDIQHALSAGEEAAEA
eukprot:CAMPEP_0174229422 /NCGR_PEP_ID=MMETSP0417-20130205/408_1 /TAXON_ID=242541 /ORGANISM="Mayorella sp, Strain BSH-02190019" /LENGTH=214 /DNA_ID=CAMNT_0015306969 /DNA_START=101 /DNA_END=742 /DNA_ORIENTATION=+